MEVGNLLGEWNHEDWEVVDDDDDDAVAPTTAARNYIDNMRSGSGLHLRKREATQQAYNRHDERGLFGLFVTEKLKATWRTWTNIILVAKGEAPATVSEIDAYIGLEMAMSLVPITDIKEFWSDKAFQGHADFKATMSRTRFQVIRGSFQLHPQYGNYGELVDTASSSDTEETAAAASKASAAREAAANAAEAAAAAEVASTAAEAAAEAAKAAQAAETAAEAAEAAAEAAVIAADAAAAMVGCVHGSDTIRTDVHENEMTGDLIQTENGTNEPRRHPFTILKMEVGNLLGEWNHEDWEVVDDDDDDAVAPTTAARNYIDNMRSGSGLHLRKREATQQAYNRHDERGLFGLFVTEKLKATWRTWTNIILVAKGEAPATVSEIDAYIGLEMAMSLVPITDIKEFWSDKAFQGHVDFKATMSRTRFQVIRGSFQLHPQYGNYGELVDTASSSDTEETAAAASKASAAREAAANAAEAAAAAEVASTAAEAAAEAAKAAQAAETAAEAAEAAAEAAVIAADAAAAMVGCVHGSDTIRTDVHENEMTGDLIQTENGTNEPRRHPFTILKMEVGNLLGEWNHEDWEVVDDDDDDAVAPTTAARNYIDNMRSGSGLHLRKREATQQAYNRHDERGLFGLFVTEKLKATWRTWTNIILVAKGEAPATVSEIDAYIGLEMAMSLVPITDIKEFWSDKAFQGHADFKATMSRTRFQVIRGSFQLHPQYGNYGELVDTASSSDTEETAAAASKASAAREAAANAAEAAAAAEVASTAAEAAAEAAKAAQAAETAAEAAEAAAEAAVIAADAAAAMVGCVHGSDTIRTDVHENEMTGDLIQTENGTNEPRRHPFTILKMEVGNLLGEWNHEDWEVVDDDDDDAVAPTTAARNYIDNMRSGSGLHLRKREATQQAYNRHDERGLFGLFVTEKLKATWRTWTNIILVAKGEAPATVSEIDAYIGLEMAMSLVPITDIKEFWSDKAFQGHADFKATMSRTRFQVIRGSFQLHPQYGNYGELVDTASSSDTEETAAAASKASAAQEAAANAAEAAAAAEVASTAAEAAAEAAKAAQAAETAAEAAEAAAEAAVIAADAAAAMVGCVHGSDTIRTDVHENEMTGDLIQTENGTNEPRRHPFTILKMEVGNLLGEWNHEDWEVVDDDDDDAVAPTTAARNYIDNMRSGSGLHLRKREATQQAYNRHDERGLFGLFVTEKLKATWRTWTNIILVAKGEAPATVSEIDAYIGLEMAMSLVPITDIKEFWSDKAFQGHADFKATMSRTRFQVIRGSFQLHPQYGNYGELVDTASSSDTEETAAAASKASAAREAAANAAEAAAAAEVASTAAEAAAEAAKAAQAAETAAEAAEAAAEAAVIAADAAAAMVGCVHGSDTIRTDVHENEMTGDLIQTEEGAERRSSEDEVKARQDPLRHSRLLLEHFQRRFAAIAVPYGISSIDEIGVRTKARTLARSFMPLKPDKFAIRFYAVVGWESLYVHSFGIMGPAIRCQRQQLKDTRNCFQACGILCTLSSTDPTCLLIPMLPLRCG